MTEPALERQLYPKLNDENLYKVKFMLDKQKHLREKLTHYQKVKNKWSAANTVLKATGITVSCLLAGASIIATAPFSLPIVAAILSSISLGNATLTSLAVEGYTSKRLKYFRLKCDHVKACLDKMELLVMKTQEDGVITTDEFNSFQKLLKDFEKESAIKGELKSKDVRKVEKLAKKQIRQQQVNTLLQKTVQEYQQKLN